MSHVPVTLSKTTQVLQNVAQTIKCWIAQYHFEHRKNSPTSRKSNICRCEWSDEPKRVHRMCKYVAIRNVRYLNKGFDTTTTKIFHPTPDLCPLKSYLNLVPSFEVAIPKASIFNKINNIIAKIIGFMHHLGIHGI